MLSNDAGETVKFPLSIKPACEGLTVFHCASACQVL